MNEVQDRFSSMEEHGQIYVIPSPDSNCEARVSSSRMTTKKEPNRRRNYYVENLYTPERESILQFGYGKHRSQRALGVLIKVSKGRGILSSTNIEAPEKVETIEFCTEKSKRRALT